MNEEEKERLQNIVSNLDRDVKLPPYDEDTARNYSREYQAYKDEEIAGNQKDWYQKLCLKSGKLLNLRASKGMRNSLLSPLRLLDWEISPSMIVSASMLTGFVSLFAWFILVIINFLLGMPIPLAIVVMTLVIPIGMGFYIYYKPKIEAQNKVIRSSGEMIMSILYMVVYMRSSPNLEGAVRFAALNLEGPIAADLKKVLWDVEVGNYSNVHESLYDYTKVWKDYNDDYLQSLQLIEAAMNDPNKERRKEMLQDSIDSILDGTRERMKHYAQNLKTPVMILNAMGAMLPVLGMIMLPLISVFMGAAITPMHLIMFFNVLLPLGLFWFMQRILASRPPTTSTTAVSKETMPPRNIYSINLVGKEITFPVWVVGVFIFLIIGFYGFAGYISFPYFYPSANITDLATTAPNIYTAGSGNEIRLNPIPMLVRSVTITYGLGVAIGVSLILGNTKRKKKEDSLKKIEKQFPEALFQLGNQVAGGTPVEVALKDAADNTREMEISGLFDKASENIENLGYTFKQSLFDRTHGALREYPSRTINTVMKAVMESSEKGTQMASMAMMTISRYLQNIHRTQETLNDLLEETTSTITMLAYLLAPVVSGVAVGMSQTIISAMFTISSSFNQQQDAIQGSQQGGQFGGILSNLDNAIAPELLQFVVGIYLIQLLFILGTFYTKIAKGEDKTYRNLMVGKLLLIGCTLYAIVLILVGVVFGGVVQSVAGGV